MADHKPTPEWEKQGSYTWRRAHGTDGWYAAVEEYPENPPEKRFGAVTIAPDGTRHGPTVFRKTQIGARNVAEKQTSDVFLKAMADQIKGRSKENDAAALAEPRDKPATPAKPGRSKADRHREWWKAQKGASAASTGDAPEKAAADARIIDSTPAETVEVQVQVESTQAETVTPKARIASTDIERQTLTGQVTDDGPVDEPTVALARCEAALFDGFVAQGKALKEIQSRQLYIPAGYGTLGDYTAARWSMSKSAAYRLISASSFVSRLEAAGSPVMPSSVTQVDALRKIAKHDGQENAQQVLEAAAKSGPVTEQSIIDAATAHGMWKERPPADRGPGKPSLARMHKSMVALAAGISEWCSEAVDVKYHDSHDDLFDAIAELEVELQNLSDRLNEAGS